MPRPKKGAGTVPGPRPPDLRGGDAERRRDQLLLDGSGADQASPSGCLRRMRRPMFASATPCTGFARPAVGGNRHSPRVDPLVNDGGLGDCRNDLPLPAARTRIGPRRRRHSRRPAGTNPHHLRAAGPGDGPMRRGGTLPCFRRDFSTINAGSTKMQQGNLGNLEEPGSGADRNRYHFRRPSFRAFTGSSAKPCPDAAS